MLLVSWQVGRNERNSGFNFALKILTKLAHFLKKNSRLCFILWLILETVSNKSASQQTKRLFESFSGNWKQIKLELFVKRLFPVLLANRCYFKRHQLYRKKNCAKYGPTQRKYFLIETISQKNFSKHII